jgi:sulfatase maturation enzyme AslB (radical SAM superfamily)
VILGTEEFFFLHCEHDATKAIVYAPLRRYLAILSKKAVEDILSRATSHARTTLLLRVQTRPLLDVQNSIAMCHTPRPEMSLALTHNCALGCLYCYATAGETRLRRSLSPEAIDCVLAEFFRRVPGANAVRINFNGGGEPTSDLPLLQYAVHSARSLARKAGKNAVFALSTNGFYGEMRWTGFFGQPTGLNKIERSGGPQDPSQVLRGR